MRLNGLRRPFRTRLNQAGHIVTGDGRTPLSIAEGKGHKDFVKSIEAYLALKSFKMHEYSDEYQEEMRMMDEL